VLTAQVPAGTPIIAIVRNVLGSMTPTERPDPSDVPRTFFVMMRYCAPIVSTALSANGTTASSARSRP
jgi:hypothetical protein